jgi:hypothetical protein
LEGLRDLIHTLPKSSLRRTAAEQVKEMVDMRYGQRNASDFSRALFVKGLAACLLIAGLIFLAGPVYAQINETGTITGTVTDESGAAIPGAAVTITNVGTNVAVPLKTNGSGEFTQVGLNVGNYTVAVSMAGFGSYQENNFYLAPTSTYTVKVILKPGGTASTVDVAADAVHTELSTNEVSTEITGKETENLPLNGQNYQQLATLMPGVLNLAANTTMATGGYVANNQVSVNGMGVSSVFYTLDGIWNEETGNLLTNTVTPPPEAIEQVKVLQNNYSVQYNMMGGSVFMVHTKTGTSQFHGQAWYLLRNEAFNALNYFVIPSVDANPPFRWNIGGIGLGGPLFIPHLYNTNRQKTFFYINGQYVKKVTYTVAYASAPTPDEINGIFPSEIHDPVTQVDFPSSLGGPKGVQYTIPSNKIVPAAQALLRTFTPTLNAYNNNCQGQCDVIQLSTDDYVLTNPVLFKQLNTMGKIDHEINDRFHVTAEYFNEGVRDQLSSASRMGSNYPGNYDIFYNNDSAAQIHLNERIGGTMLNQISVAMDRYVVTHTYGGLHLVSQVPGYSQQLAYPSTIIGLAGQWLPDITFSDGWTKFGTNSTDTQWRTAYLAETLTDNWNWSKGKHNFAAGGTFLLGRSRLNSEADNTTGTFNFSGYATGTPVADFLVGFASNYTQGNTVVRKELTYPIYSPYAEDQWKILPRLTLTAGVRYSYMPFANAQQGYATAFYPSAFNPSQAPTVNTDGSLTLTPGYNPTNGMIYNGFKGVPYNLSNAHQNYVSPSVGFAYDFFGDGRVSLRGGYAINYLKSGSSSDCQSNCIGLPAVSEVELTDASFPDPLNGLAAVPTAGTVYGEDIKNIQAAMIHSYSLSLQQQFGPNWLTEITFAGIAGRHLPLELNINQPPPIPGYDYNPIFNQLNPPSTAQYGPYQGYGTINYATSTGIANWNALELSVRHPTGHGLTMRAQFTWSHGLSDVPSTDGYADENSGVQDAYHPERSYGNTELNQHLSFASGLVYSVPWFTHTGWTKSAFGGWQASAIVGFLSGVNYSVGVSTSNHGLTTRANMNPLYPLQRYKGSFFSTDQTGRVGPFFNTCAFGEPLEQVSCPPGTFESPDFNGTFGNSPVGIIEGPGTEVDHVSLFKTFPVHDTLNLRFRASAFNLANHPNFTGQDTTLGDTNYGYYTSAADPRQMEFAVELFW